MLSPGIEAFLRIAKSRSVSRAAEELHLSQPSVSKRLQLLEETLGYPLFERGKGVKSLRLTPQGARFLEIAERMENLAAEARQVAHVAQGHKLVIGGHSSSTITFIPKLVARLLESDPRISLKLLSIHAREMYDAVERRDVDVGFSLAEQARQSVIAKACFAVPMLGIRSVRQKGRSVERLESLDPANLIYIPWGSRYQIWHDLWLGSKNPPRISGDIAILLFRLLDIPDTWAIAPTDIAGLLLASGRFTTFELIPEPPPRVYFKLTHKFPTPDVQAALDLFENVLEHMLQDEEESAYVEL